MSERPRAWVLNLDAEHELEIAKSYTPSAHLRAIVARESPRLIGTLVAPGDIVLTEEDVLHGTERAKLARGLPGVAWCPTRRAQKILLAAGANPVRAPSIETLRRVNARPFAAQLRTPIAGASFGKQVVDNLEQVLASLAHPAPNGWLVRRTFGAAGRGRRRIYAGRPSDAERMWLEASLRRGPLVVEPWVEVVREYTRSGWVDVSGHVSISRPCFQQTTPHGVWTRTDCAGASEVPREDDARLEETMSIVGDALARAGYFGPFGIDAYRHRALDGTGRTILNPLSEINARFTMDWATAFALDPARGIAHERATELLGLG